MYCILKDGKVVKTFQGPKIEIDPETLEGVTISDVGLLTKAERLAYGIMHYERAPEPPAGFWNGEISLEILEDSVKEVAALIPKEPSPVNPESFNAELRKQIAEFELSQLRFIRESFIAGTGMEALTAVDEQISAFRARFLPII